MREARTEMYSRDKMEKDEERLKTPNFFSIVEINRFLAIITTIIRIIYTAELFKMT